MFTGVSIPYISYIGVLTADPKERLSANGYRMFFAQIANWVIISSIPALASMWGNGDTAKGYQLAMALMSFVGVLLLLFCFFSTRERVEHVVDKKPLSEQFKLLLKNDSGWYWRLAAYSARWDTPCVAVLPCTTPFICSVPARLWRGSLSERELWPPLPPWWHPPGSPNVTVKSSCSAGRNCW